METRLKPTWDWMLTVMDATEAQLRFGASLTNSTDPSHPLHPLNPSQPSTSSINNLSVPAGKMTERNKKQRTNSVALITGNYQPRRAATLENTQSTTGTNTRIVGFSTTADNQRNFDRDGVAQTARREFLTYALSLMRSHSSEHRDSLPVLDVTALRHIAYVLDGIIFYMRAGKESDVDKSDINIWADLDENENDDGDDEPIDGDDLSDSAMYMLGSQQGRRHSFFQRSESTLCLGCPPPDPFNTPMCESLPLADQPHLLQPNARREDLFGIPKQPITIPSNGSEPPGVNSPLELPPTMLGLSPHRNIVQHYDGAASTSTANVAGDFETDRAGPSDPVAVTDEETVQDAKLEPRPSTSKEKRKRSEHSESYGNIYMQLKKKSYFDHSEDDSRSYEKEGPQDLSFGKESSSSSKMDVDSEGAANFAFESDSGSHQSTSEPLAGPSTSANVSVYDDSLTIRPQIIVTPRKVAAAIESVTAAVLAKNKKTSLSECAAAVDTPITALPTSFPPMDLASGSGTSDSFNPMSQGSSSGSPSKSVIVRAGKKAEKVSVLCLIAKILIGVRDTEFSNELFEDFHLNVHRTKPKALSNDHKATYKVFACEQIRSVQTTKLSFPFPTFIRKISRFSPDMPQSERSAAARRKHGHPRDIGARNHRNDARFTEPRPRRNGTAWPILPIIKHRCPRPHMGSAVGSLASVTRPIRSCVHGRRRPGTRLHRIRAAWLSRERGPLPTAHGEAAQRSAT